MKGARCHLADALRLPAGFVEPVRWHAWLMVAALSAPAWRKDPELVRHSERLLRESVFPFLATNGAAAVRLAFGDPQALFAEGAAVLVSELSAWQAPATAEGLLAAALADAGLELLGQPEDADAVFSSDMNIVTWQTALFGIALAAGVLAAWDAFHATPEFRLLSTRFGRRPWARRLLRHGPALAARERWQIVAAWPAARLEGPELEEAVEGLVTLGGRRIAPAVGAPFEAGAMTAAAGAAEFVAATLRPGLAWENKVVEPALVEAGTADYVALRRVPDGPAKTHLLAALGGVPRPDAKLDQAMIDDVLDRMRSSEEAESWLETFAHAWPAGTLEALVPQPGEPLDEAITRTTRVIAAPQHAVVEVVRHRGLRRRGGAVLVRARVETVQHAAARQLI